MTGLWYALNVLPRFEMSVVAHLLNRGYDSFLPMCAPNCSGRLESLKRPLFPRYVFCRLDLKTSEPVLTTPGVNYIVGIGSGPEPVAERELEWLRTIVKS